MEDRRAFLIDGCWKLDGIEDQHATRVVQAIRSRRYVNQNEIAEALGIDQRRVSGGGERVTKGHWGPFRRGGPAGLLGGYHRGTGVAGDVVSLHREITGLPFSLVGSVDR